MSMASIGTRRSTASSTGSSPNRFDRHFTALDDQVGRVTGSWGESEQGLNEEYWYIEEALSGIVAFARSREQQELGLSTTPDASVVLQNFGYSVLSVPQRDNTHRWSLLTTEHCRKGPRSREVDHDDIETLDWDAQIRQIPPSPSRRVVLRFVKGSYRPARIVDDPEE